MHNLKSKEGLCNNTQKVQNVEVKRLINSTTEISKGFLRLHGKNKTNTLNKLKRQMQMAPLKKVFNLTCAKRNTNHIYFDISFFTSYPKIWSFEIMCFQQGWREEGTSFYCWWQYKLVKFPTGWAAIFNKIINSYIPWSAVSLPGIYSTDTLKYCK